MKEEKEFEEGVEILDPELKAKQEAQQEAAKIKAEKLRCANEEVNSALKTLKEKCNMVFYLSGYSEEFDEIGIWKTEGLNSLQEMGFNKLMQNQF